MTPLPRQDEAPKSIATAQTDASRSASGTTAAAPRSNPSAPVAVAAPAPPASAPAPAAPSEPPAATPAPLARVGFAVTPWGEVYVDGRKTGITPPLREIALPPGRHTIEVRNSTFKPHRQTVDLAEDASIRIKHKFE
jgi:serine/threonine-protein kinase